MRILKWLYRKRYGKEPPYYYNYSIGTILAKPVRKFFAQVIAPNCPFNHLRVWIYRRCGFQIGKRTFIGMKCYLDDMCYDLLKIGSDVTISYGVYFACHGKGQGHLPITIEDHAYIGMRAMVISKTKEGQGVTIGPNAVVGAGALVNQNIPGEGIAVGVPCRILASAPPVSERAEENE